MTTPIADPSVQSARPIVTPPSSQTDGSVSYTVRDGETIEELSARYGVSEQQILAANPQLRSLADLGPGQEISIPIVDNGGTLPTQTQVHPKETLATIAHSYGVSVDSLATANGIANPNKVGAGKSLWIPVVGVADAGKPLSANPLQPQIDAVDAAVKQYQGARNDTQIDAASTAIAEAVEKELSARAAFGLPRGQSPSDSQLASYGAAISSRYGNDPQIASRIQQGVSNESAALQTTAKVKQLQAAQEALRLAKPNTTDPDMRNQLSENVNTAKQSLLTQVEQEIATRAGLPAGQLPSAADIQQYGPEIAQRYAGDSTAANAVNTALQAAPDDVTVQNIVAQANAAGDPSKALAALNQAYTKASPQIQQLLLTQAGVQSILKNAAAQQTKPLADVQKSDDTMELLAGLRQGLTNLDNSAKQLDPTLAAALVNEALPALNQFSAHYAKVFGGGIDTDTLHAGPVAVPLIMDLSGHIAGTAQGDDDIAQLAQIGFWDNNSVSNALYGGASAAYPEAVARYYMSKGVDLTNGLSIIQQGVQRDQHIVQDDVKALAEHNAELNWLVQNVGPAMTPQQLQAAVTKYEGEKGWSEQNAKLTQKLIADSTTLTQNMKILNDLAASAPQVASRLNVQGTITAAFNDPSVGYGMALAAGQNPSLYSDSQGQSFLNTVSGLKLADQGRKTAQLVGSLYVRSMVTNALKQVNWKGPNPLGQAQGIIESLKSPALSNWMGVNDQTVWNSAVKTVEDNLVAQGDSEETKAAKLATIDQKLNRLKALSASTPAGQLLRSVAVAYALASTVNDAEKLQSSEGAFNTALEGAQTLTAAAGLVQKGANLANGFGWVSESSKNAFSKWAAGFAKDSVNGKISLIGAGFDILDAVRSGFGLGEEQDTGKAVLSGISGLGGTAYGLSQFAEADIFASVGESWFGGMAGGTLAAGLGLVGVGLVAVSVIGTSIYQENNKDHQYEGAAKDFLQSGNVFTPSAADALKNQGGIFSGAGGASGVPFLVKYASMMHLSTDQLQTWVNHLTPSQQSTLDKLLLQTAGDSKGDPANFTDGPPQTTTITDYSSGWATVLTLNNTLGVFQNNLKSSGIPLPP